jgi:hypothetical protein
MRHNRRLVLTEMANQADDILDEKFDAIVLNSSRLVAEIEAAHVRSNDMKVSTQDWQLMAPRIPTFRKTMKEDYEVITRAAFSVVQAYVTNIRKTVLDNELALRLHGGPHSPD